MDLFRDLLVVGLLSLRLLDHFCELLWVFGFLDSFLGFLQYNLLTLLDCSVDTFDSLLGEPSKTNLLGSRSVILVSPGPSPLVKSGVTAPTPSGAITRGAHSFLETWAATSASHSLGSVQFNIASELFGEFLGFHGLLSFSLDLFRDFLVIGLLSLGLLDQFCELLWVLGFLDSFLGFLQHNLSALLNSSVNFLDSLLGELSEASSVGRRSVILVSPGSSKFMKSGVTAPTPSGAKA